MIERMKFLSITGPKADIDRVVNDYLSKYEIHLENALSELRGVQNLTPYIEINPYREYLNKANEICNVLRATSDSDHPPLALNEAIHFIRKLDKDYTALKQKLTDLEVLQDKMDTALQRIRPFKDLHYNLSTLLEFEFIRFRFGKIAKENYGKFQDYVYSNFDTFFYACGEDNSFVWGIYFCPRSQLKKIDAVYASMHFEIIYLPKDYSGTPDEVFASIGKKYTGICADITKYRDELDHLLNDQGAKIRAARDTLDSLSRNFDVRKLAACTKDELEVFYILCGWMSEKDVGLFQKDIENDENLYCIIEDEDNNITRDPPTKLKNPKICRPFEMFTRMYGLPAYHELDPTIFVSLTYALIFGAMFGDVGQGLFLVIGGMLLYKLKGSDLAAIVSMAGVFSTIFGFMFGSVFGFEIIEPLWLRPINQMMSVPFIGTLNTVFVVSIVFGMFLILLTMVFHVINAIRTRDTVNIWFDHNALAGLIFYGSVVAVILLFMSGKAMPASVVLFLMFGLPLLLILFKEPLTRRLEKKNREMTGSKGMFLVQGFFELFEILLSYFSNTLSFVRIGAFALSHAAMMQVVLSLAGAESGGSINWLVVILGNIFVCGMEGLIVGIQVLRLEYYELFSRFYKGTGREFIPFLSHKHK